MHTTAFVFPGAYATAMILAYRRETDPSARTASLGVGDRLSDKRTAITATNECSTGRYGRGRRYCFCCSYVKKSVGERSHSGLGGGA